MHTPTCRGQEVDSIPAHLQQQESYDEPPVGVEATRAEPVVDIAEINRPGGGCPCLLRVPCPEVAPSLFCPDASRKHAERQEGDAYAGEAVAGGQITLRTLPQPSYGKQEGAAEDAVGKHIYRNVGNEPCALQGRHKALVVDVGF